ncbi:STAS domain-containing protein [Glaesserella parasuis]|uniref:STAS domain-containing protein n=1 Tax=Glaesserella parasuis TaxID=738 RepID=UPI0003F68B38|nr:STAS domain-containing protein [Glaesserella parasuis]ATW45177.1 NTP binding protein (Contains STAS domain) [Glaesserella parasuis str. Nagasaki]EYE71224.1 putative anti-sigma factor B antagonist [Glaesserella parasuis str. Nagasaki]MDP0068457.1 STAS domain-containing protein [Glaesserella parasuis]MDP0244364.1 STAS domain-containing protein [Glaesserella parasuis]MDP0278555.1 STAS domain-containing protein [Glaesserella parasuis]
MQTKNPLQWHIQQNNESLMVQLSGELARDTLLPLWKQRASFLSPKSSQHIYWDLKGLTSIDSSGFTLLAELLHHYQQKNKNCLFNVPQAVHSLAELFDLAGWFKKFLFCEKK